MIYGYCKGCDPKKPKAIQVATHIQKITLVIVLALGLSIFKLSYKGIKATDKIIAPITATPNTLLSIDLKTAYNGKKYHSGTICAGVTKELAII